MPGNKNSGRPRKPTAKLKLHGTFRDDRHATRFDDSELPSDIIQPEKLSAIEAEFWNSQVPEMIVAGYVRRIDKSQLHGMCYWWARWVICSRWLNHRQATEGFDGAIEQIELIAKIQGMTQRAWGAFSSIAGRFGMSPADRARLVEEQKQKPSEFDQDIAKHA